MMASAAPPSNTTAVPPTRAVHRRASVVVIGAGLAGLAATYALRKRDIDVVLVEARHRIGGRVHTVPLAGGEYFDAGGEFVSPGHTCFLRHAKQFGIALESSRFYDGEPRITLGHRTWTPEQSRASMADVAGTLEALAEQARSVDPAAPWTAAQAPAQDRISLRDWLATQRLDPRARDLLRLYWEAGNGIDVESQSYLAVLAQTAADAEQVNALRCVGGASTLPRAIAAAIGTDRIFLGRPVISVDCEHGVRVASQDGSIFESDWAILATPPGPWQAIRFRPEIADPPQMGTVVKFVQVFAAPAPVATKAFCDAYITATWGGTESVLVGFAGGPAAQRCRSLEHGVRDAFLAARVQEMTGQPLPAAQATHFHDWAAEPFTRGGYSAPAPGQITRAQGRWQAAHHRLFFAGEHTSPGFFGFMEGALQSGETAASRLVTQAFG